MNLFKLKLKRTVTLKCIMTQTLNGGLIRITKCVPITMEDQYFAAYNNFRET